MADKQDWYFTFGAGQEHDGYFVCVKNKKFDEARIRMVNEYGTAWSGQYTVSQFMYYRLNERMKFLKDLD